ncbi:MAG: hypothetical protein EB023_10880 [Flavobacteriia bacterium]|nr:hypothetical protein [Flavobacteriia bacterium]
MVDKKRIPAFASEKISSLEDISIFTNEEEVKLSEVFTTLLGKYEGREGLGHKSNEQELRAEFTSIVPNYDLERVYLSDIRKVFQWYNLLIKEGVLKLEVKEEVSESDTNSDSSTIDNVETKKTEVKKEPKKSNNTKSTTSNKTAATNAPKPSASKKPPTIKTGSSRGK